jgi:SH3 domain protein
MLSFAAQARGVEYIRDEVRINMRSGPGPEFRIVRVLASGQQLTRIGAHDGWLQVRTTDGKDGWVPSRYITLEVPPSVSLPKVQAELEIAHSNLDELRAQLAAQSEAIKELGALRDRSSMLEQENRRLFWADTWKKWLTGSGIAAIFLLVGGMWPRNSQRNRKIQL